jgi:hypothetical protein
MAETVTRVGAIPQTQIIRDTNDQVTPTGGKPEVFPTSRDVITAMSRFSALTPTPEHAEFLITRSSSKPPTSAQIKNAVDFMASILYKLNERIQQSPEVKDRLIAISKSRSVQWEYFVPARTLLQVLTSNDDNYHTIAAKVTVMLMHETFDTTQQEGITNLLGNLGALVPEFGILLGQVLNEAMQSTGSLTTQTSKNPHN